MSTIKTTTLSNVAGTASVPVDTVINGSAKAWVNFNGTGTVAIRASFNVSSITDNGTGNYTVNFTTALADANYSVCNSQYGYDFPSSIVANNLAIQSLTTGSFRLFSTGITNAAVDVDQIHAAVFR